MADAVTDYVYPGGELDVFSAAGNWKSYIARLLRGHVAGRVLEVGAGIGATTLSLWNDSVRFWTCLEPDAMLASRLRSATRELRPKPEVIAGTIGSLPPSRHFDSILYIDVLEHIVADRAELVTASNHLASGGKLIVLSPAFQCLYSEFDHAVGHERRYTASSLSGLMPSILTKKALFYADSVGATLSMGNRLFLRRSTPTLRQVTFWDRRLIPLSRLVDPWLARWWGRSVIAVYTREPDKQSLSTH